MRGRRGRGRNTPDTARRVPLRRAFATPALRRCQLAVGVSRFVETAVLVTASVALFDRGGAAAVALYGVVTTLGPAFGTPMVAALAGRRQPGAALGTCLGLSAVALAATTWALGADGPLVVVLATVGVAVVMSASVRPLVTSQLPGFIRSPGELAATNTAAAGVETISVILGPLLAAAGLALTTPTTVLAAATTVLTLTGTAMLGLGHVPRATDAPQRLLADVLHGLRATLRRGPIRLVTLLVGSQTFVRGALHVIVVSLAIERLGLDDSGVGVLLGAIGVGGLVGLPIAAAVAGAGRHARNLVAGLLLWGLPIAALGLTTVDPVALVLLGIAGLGNTVVDISTDSLLQRLAPHGRLAALLGSFEAVLFLAKAAGAGAAGLLLAVTDPGTAILVVGAVPVALVLVGALPAAHVDRDFRDRNTALAVLQTNGIFSPLVLSAVDQLSSATLVEHFAPGDAILVEGEVGDRYYVIEAGEVDVLRGGGVIDAMGPGDGFGEVALLDGAPRNATIVARTPVTTHALDRARFLAALAPGSTSRSEAERVADERRHDTPPPHGRLADDPPATGG